MSLPQSYREYHLIQYGSLSAENFGIREAKFTPLKGQDVVVKIHAVSLNYRDLLISQGNYARKSKDDLIPCSDMAGEIVSVGREVKRWKVGQRVCANFALDHLFGDSSPEIVATSLGGGDQDGVLAEYKVFPAHSLVEIPSHLSYEEASTLPCAAVTAYNSLLGPIPLKGGDTVLILGTGGVSIFGLQIAVASGATTIVTSSSDSKLQVAKELGAHHIINYNKIKDWEKEVKRITGGKGADHVVEIGGAGTFAKSLEAVRDAGHIHLVGFLAGTDGQDITTQDLVIGAIMKAVTLRGIKIGSVAQFEDMNRLFAAQSIKPAVDKVFKFEDAIAAYEYLKSQSHVGKVVIQVGRQT